MFLDFLHEKELQLRNGISLKKKELSSVRLKIKENDRIAMSLDKSASNLFDDFVPQIINSSDKKRKEALLEDEAILRDMDSKLQEELDSLEIELNAVVDAIKDANDFISDLKQNNLKNMGEVISKLEKIRAYIIQDPNRASVELSNLIIQLSN